MVPGSISTEARELFQEGLRLPAVKLISEGRPIRSVVEILKANSRLPDFLHGDMWAGIAAARVGERRILELARRYGADTFVAALRSFMDHGEQVARRALGELPQGVFRLEEEQDNGAVYRVTVEIAGDELVVDLRDNPNQDPGPNNISRDAAVIAAQILLMNLTDPHAPANEGHYRPLRVLTRPGSVYSVQQSFLSSFFTFQLPSCSFGARATCRRTRRRLCRAFTRRLRPARPGARRRRPVRHPLRDDAAQRRGIRYRRRPRHRSGRLSAGLESPTPWLLRVPGGHADAEALAPASVIPAASSTASRRARSPGGCSAALVTLALTAGAAAPGQARLTRLRPAAWRCVAGRPWNWPVSRFARQAPSSVVSPSSLAAAPRRGGAGRRLQSFLDSRRSKPGCAPGCRGRRRPAASARQSTITVKDRVRGVGWASRMERPWQDLRDAVQDSEEVARLHVRRRAGRLAIGISATTMIYGLLDDSRSLLGRCPCRIPSSWRSGHRRSAVPGITAAFAAAGSSSTCWPRAGLPGSKPKSEVGGREPADVALVSRLVFRLSAFTPPPAGGSPQLTEIAFASARVRVLIASVEPRLLAAESCGERDVTGNRRPRRHQRHAHHRRRRRAARVLRRRSRRGADVGFH